MKPVVSIYHYLEHKSGYDERLYFQIKYNSLKIGSQDNRIPVVCIGLNTEVMPFCLSMHDGCPQKAVRAIHRQWR